MDVIIDARRGVGTAKDQPIHRIVLAVGVGLPPVTVVVGDSHLPMPMAVQEVRFLERSGDDFEKTWGAGQFMMRLSNSRFRMKLLSRVDLRGDSSPHNLLQ